MLINDKVDAVYIPDSPSRIKATDYNQIKNEIQECITEAGLTPTKDVIQLPQALKILTAQSGAEEVAKIEAAGQEQLNAINTAGGQAVQDAQTAASTATNKATEAASSATNAQNYAAQAQQSAQGAARSAEASSSSASAAQTSETAAQGYSANADAKAAQAQNYAQAAQTSAADALSSAQDAAQSAQNSRGLAVGTVYYSQSSLATDNPGALPLFTGETIASANTIYPEFYNWVLAHTELQCTSAEYESALTTYGECPKYVVINSTPTRYKWENPTTGVLYTLSRNPAVGDLAYDVTGNSSWPITEASSTEIVVPTFVDNKPLSYVEEVAGTSASIRLPKLSNYIKAANPSDGIKNIEAGLPNITGYASPKKDGYAGGGLAGGAFWLTSDTASAGHGATEAGPGTRINFDASRSSAIYGKSSTVTPASTTLYPWVVAYTAAVPASTAQAAEFQQGLSGKADTNLGNITSLGKKSSVSWIMPDYSRVVATGLAGSPTSQSTNSYTCPTDGWINMHADRSVSGNTLLFRVNEVSRASFPAFSATFANLMYPVNKGDIVNFRTDSTSSTWGINYCNFIPCKGA